MKNSHKKNDEHHDKKDHADLKKDFSFFRDSLGRLGLRDQAGREHNDVKPVRLFPISDPEHWVSLCDADRNELICIEDLNRLPGRVHQILLEELGVREFLPIIKKIRRISSRFAPSEWEVETDRGETGFILNAEDDIHRLSAHRILIIDAHRIRYLIPDMRRLDSASRRLLAHYI
ncbi:MAG TPA: DUF1854 domain-containing protein [Thermodesulfobacteriota bacterium]|nr:DUF1854 domain-containing protein [Thermodesulfobacteriota bacterium]